MCAGLKGIGGIAKLQSFCKVARDAGSRWAWMDTCCIDKKSNTELQESVNSHVRSGTAILRSPSSTYQMSLLHPSPVHWRGVFGTSEDGPFRNLSLRKPLYFIRRTWSLSLDNRFLPYTRSLLNHEGIGGATGIDSTGPDLLPVTGCEMLERKLRGHRKRSHNAGRHRVLVVWYLRRSYLPVIYGEKKAKCAREAPAGDPDIISYAAPPCSPTIICPEDEIQTAVSSMRNIVTVDSALSCITLLEDMNAPLFATCRLRLPCIAFRVTEVKRRPSHAAHSMYGVKADGVRDLVITTDEDPNSILAGKAHSADVLSLTFADEGESVGDWPESESGSDDTHEPSSDLTWRRGIDSSLGCSLAIIAFDGSTWAGFQRTLVAQQRVGEYKRIASDHNIIARSKTHGFD
ncbi:hypothetical protein EV424DRAFT_1570491 [Suillus variegatus]|nr:hypothetical protein EV424DRAFT_1570491 [Suillus variegatus]